VCLHVETRAAESPVELQTDAAIRLVDTASCVCVCPQNAPVLTDPRARAPPAVLLVNIIRGSVLRGARVWILGRHAAVSQIPPQHVDVVTEIRGFR